MEKRKAHYDLKAIKEYVARVGFDDAFTQAAQIGALNMGLSPDAAMNVVMGLTKDMLYKSMTTHADHKVWQDVYHAFCLNGKIAYIKVTLQEGSVVIQFKEL
jgi:motility quorum-sensing regulator/GCU-specific mRNA interferase toxin